MKRELKHCYLKRYAIGVINGSALSIALPQSTQSRIITLKRIFWCSLSAGFLLTIDDTYSGNTFINAVACQTTNTQNPLHNNIDIDMIQPQGSSYNIVLTNATGAAATFSLIVFYDEEIVSVE
jgi:hypothetical protein